MLKGSISKLMDATGIWVLMIFIISLYDGPLSAKDQPLKIGRLTLSFHADEKFVPKAFRERLGQDWESFCKDFAANFIVGKGPQGRGVFNKAECQAIDFSQDASDFTNLENLWLIAFTWSGKGFFVEIYFQANGKKSKPFLVSRLVLPQQLTPDVIFTTPEAKYYVVNGIYRRLPVGWNGVFNRSDTEWKQKPLHQALASVVSPPKRVDLFTLAYNAEQNLWVPTLFAIAQPPAIDDNTKESNKLGGGLELRWVRTPSKAKVRLWAQEIYNPLEPEPPYVSSRDGDHNMLEGYALEGLKSNSIALRYGIPYPKGNTVVSQASKIEAIAGIGKGFLEGLMLGVEFSPRLEDKQEKTTYSYTFTRVEVGWSMILGEPQTIDRFATRFRLTPKISLLSLDAYFPLDSNEDADVTTTAQFRLSKQFELGGEFSWELESLSYRWKAWVSTHLSGYVLAPKHPTKLSNQRAGADFSYDVFKTRGGLRVGAVAFGYIDWVTLQEEVPADFGLNLTATTNSTSASGASFSVTYLGLGLSVTW